MADPIPEALETPGITNQASPPTQTQEQPVPVGAISQPATPPPPDPIQEATKLGGPLGGIALGALTGAAKHPDGGNVSTPVPGEMPVPAGAVPAEQPVPVGAVPSQHNVTQMDLLSRAKNLANELVDQMPVVGDVHQIAGALHDWADRQLQKPQTQISPWKTLGTGLLRDTTGAISEANSAEGLAVAASQFVPYLNVAVDTSLAGHGIYNMIKGWGDISNPDVLQNELNSSAETIGGLAGLSEGVKGIHQTMQNKKIAGWKDQQYEDFKNAVPPSKSANYTEMDYQAARPYMDRANATGNPVDGSAQSVVDALDAKISENETKLARVIDANPTEVISTNPVDEVRQALAGNIRQSFFQEGMKALEDYPVGFQRGSDPLNPQNDPPLTLRRADDIRHQLNQDNRAAMKGKNNYDYANMMQTDPAFAARNAAAEALRNGIYDTLEKLGVKDAGQIRLDEGSMIKVRDAALRQLNKEQTTVKASAKPAGKVKKAVSKGVKTGGAALGALGGAATGIPGGAEVGAGLGSLAGGSLGEVLEGGKPLTREELINKAFETPQQFKPAPVPMTAQPAKAAVAAGAANVASSETENNERRSRSTDEEHYHDFHQNERGEVVHTPQ